MRQSGGMNGTLILTQAHGSLRGTGRHGRARSADLRVREPLIKSSVRAEPVEARKQELAGIVPFNTAQDKLRCAQGERYLFRASLGVLRRPRPRPPHPHPRPPLEGEGMSHQDGLIWARPPHRACPRVSGGQTSVSPPAEPGAYLSELLRWQKNCGLLAAQCRAGSSVASRFSSSQKRVNSSRRRPMLTLAGTLMVMFMENIGVPVCAAA